MIEPLKNELEPLIKREIRRSREAYGEMYNSPHEAYAVLREEIEEAQSEIKDITRLFFERDLGLPRKGVWGVVSMFKLEGSSRDTLRGMLDTIRDTAQYGAAELIQVAAVAQKAMESMDAWTQKKEG